MLNEATLLNMIASLGNPELQKLAGKLTILIPVDSPLRTEIAVRIAGALSAWVESQGKGKSPLIEALIEKLSDLMEFCGNELFDSRGAPHRDALRGARERFMSSAAARLAAAERDADCGPETVNKVTARLKQEAEALLAIEGILYPPGMKPEPFDWGAVFARISDTVTTLNACAAVHTKKIADWAESLPGAKRPRRGQALAS